MCSKIGSKRVAHVVHIELAANVKIEEREGLHIDDLRNFTMEDIIVHGQDAIGLNANGKLCFFGDPFGCCGNHAT